MSPFWLFSKCKQIFFCWIILTLRAIIISFKFVAGTVIVKQIDPAKNLSLKTCEVIFHVLLNLYLTKRWQVTHIAIQKCHTHYRVDLYVWMCAQNQYRQPCYVYHDRVCMKLINGKTLQHRKCGNRQRERERGRETKN